MSAAEHVEAVLIRYRRALSFDQAILIAASEAAGDALDPYRSGDAAVILHAEALLQRGLRVREAIGEARIVGADVAAADRDERPRTAGLRAEMSLDDVLRDPRAGRFISGDEAAMTPHSCDDRIDLVLLERHEVGPHAIELWAPPPANRPATTCSPTGTLIGTCMRCGGGVGDKDWTFAAWDGDTWRFSGYTLRGASRLATLKPLLGCACAGRVKHKLIPPPDVSR